MVRPFAAVAAAKKQLATLVFIIPADLAEFLVLHIHLHLIQNARGLK